MSEHLSGLMLPHPSWSPSVELLKPEGPSILQNRSGCGFWTQDWVLATFKQTTICLVRARVEGRNSGQQFSHLLLAIDVSTLRSGFFPD